MKSLFFLSVVFSVLNVEAAPYAPSQLRVCNLSDTQVRLTWSYDASSPNYFYMYKGTSSSLRSFSKFAQVPGNIMTVDKSPPNATKLFYKVVAHSGSENSADSNIVSSSGACSTSPADPPPEPPIGFSPTLTVSEPRVAQSELLPVPPAPVPLDCSRQASISIAQPKNYKWGDTIPVDFCISTIFPYGPSQLNFLRLYFGGYGFTDFYLPNSPRGTVNVTIPDGTVGKAQIYLHCFNPSTLSYGNCFVGPRIDNINIDTRFRFSINDTIAYVGSNQSYEGGSGVLKMGVENTIPTIIGGQNFWNITFYSSKQFFQTYTIAETELAIASRFKFSDLKLTRDSKGLPTAVTGTLVNLGEANGASLDIKMRIWKRVPGNSLPIVYSSPAGLPVPNLSGKSERDITLTLPALTTGDYVLFLYTPNFYKGSVLDRESGRVDFTVQ